MDDPRLDDLLGRYKGAALPQPPTNLPQNVWREIRQHQSSPVSSAIRYNDFLAWFRGSLAHLVAPALAVAVVFSVGMTLADNQRSSHYQVQQALGLQVFSNQSSPLARLASNP